MFASLLKVGGLTEGGDVLPARDEGWLVIGEFVCDIGVVIRLGFLLAFRSPLGVAGTGVDISGKWLIK